jgi:NitT/TauT family transport system substrate-binding protein
MIMRGSRLLALGCIAGSAFLLAACGSGGAGQAPTTDSAGNYKLTELDATTSLLNVPTYAAEKSGAQFHIAITTTSVTGGGTANQEFAGGTGNVLVAGVDSPMRIDQQGVTDMTVLGSIAQTNVWVLVAKKGSNIHSLADLRGKTIGVSGAGAVSDIALRYELTKAGVSPSSTKIVALGAAPSQLAALEGGHADAVQLLSPTLEAALKDNQVQIVADFRKENYPALVVSARTSDVQSNPKAFCAYMSALKSSMTKVMNDHTYATRMASSLMGSAYTPAQIQTVLTDYVQNRYDPTLTFTQAQYNTAKSLLIGSGVVKGQNFPTYQALTQHQPKCGPSA